MQELTKKLLASGIVFAQSPTIAIKPSGAAWGNLGNLTVGSIISGTVILVLVAAALIFFFMLVYGGIRWMTAGGDKEKAAGARGQLTSALIGLAIVFVAWAVIQLINTLFGINIFNLTVPTLVPAH